MDFAKKCVKVRTELLLTQAQLAEKLGVTQVTVARWESGENQPQTVQYGKFLRFCKENNIDFGEEK